jgi:hypothetical protein
MEIIGILIIIGVLGVGAYFIVDALLFIGKDKALLDLSQETKRKEEAELHEYKRKLEEINVAKVEFSTAPVIHASDASDVLSGRVIKYTKRKIPITASPSVKTDSDKS